MEGMPSTILLNNGVPPIVVADRLGHSKTRITLDTYGHLIPKMQDEAARIMGASVTPLKFDLRELGARNVEEGVKKIENPE